jgi:hypothetical protein
MSHRVRTVFQGFRHKNSFVATFYLGTKVLNKTTYDHDCLQFSGYSITFKREEAEIKAVVKLSRNAVPVVFWKPERRSGTSR